MIPMAPMVNMGCCFFFPYNPQSEAPSLSERSLLLPQTSGLLPKFVCLGCYSALGQSTRVGENILSSWHPECYVLLILALSLQELSPQDLLTAVL